MNLEEIAGMLPKLEQPEGLVPFDSPFYVERPPVEVNCYETITQPTALIRINAAQQMGKSSLMARIRHISREQGYQTVYLNFKLIDPEFLTSLDQFLQWFCANITDRLNLDDEIDRYWQGIKRKGSATCCGRYFERYLLANIHQPLVLVLDEVDRIFPYDAIASVFFELLRAWHEKGKTESEWQKLRFVISHSKDVYIPLNINKSPFNVGLPIKLPPFSPEQVTELIAKHGLDFSKKELQTIVDMLGGHPYLVRVALYQIAKENISLEDFFQLASTEEGIYQDHLHEHATNLEQDRSLVAAFKQVVAADTPVSLGTTESFKLKSMGLVKFEGNQVVPFCDLYRWYFRDRSYASRLFSTGEDTMELAAIMFTDVVNSTELMMANQRIMRQLLTRDFQLMSQICQHHQGQVLKNLGDGLLVYFRSAVQAVACAIQIQKSISTEAAMSSSGRVLIHRIGIHMGDVFLSGGDVLGAGVNIAARLQGKAQPGGICISRMVYDAVKDHLALKVHALGACQLKGVPSAMELYEVLA